jgi:N-acyl-D-aspartate/D-glutamate deacylase
MIDLLFRGATILDGTGADARRGDVAVAGDRIVEPDRDQVGSATHVIDADGLVVAPGFIDLHSHADCTLPAYPGAINSITQGVTTEVTGNCGYVPAPVSPIPEHAEELRRQVRPIGPDLDWSWSTFASYLDRLDEAHPAHNVAPLAGFGALRVGAMGMADRPATAAEVETMRANLREALDAGAWGMSTGLVYPPGCYSETDEIVAVGAPLRDAHGLYFSHIRNEADDLGEAVDEAIAIGRAIGVPVQVSHLKSAGMQNHGKIGRALERIDAARAAGERVHHDVYPYTAGSTMLTQVLPPWIQADGTDGCIERLRQDEVRARLRHEITHGLPGFANYSVAGGGWHSILIASVVDPSLRWAEGRTIAELAVERDEDPLELAMDLLIADRLGTVMIVFMMAEEDMREALAHPAAAVGSDLLLVTSDTARVHPRTYGTFARILGMAARDEGPIDLATAVHKMSGHAAGILGMRDRGRIANGLVADLVAFDPSRVRDRATYAEPTLTAEGVETVVLGGRVAVDAGRVVARDAGRVLRRPR